MKRKKLESFTVGALGVLVSFLANAGGDEIPPELWSWFKDMNKSAEACEIQSAYILDKLKVSNIVENEYGIYGVYKSNRIVVKCIPQGDKSKLFVAVAGYNRDSVELLRNLIVKEIN